MHLLVVLVEHLPNFNISLHSIGITISLLAVSTQLVRSTWSYVS